MRSLTLMFLAAAMATAADVGSSGEAPLTSPRGSIKVTQQMWGDDVWHTELTFLKSDLPSIVFGDDYPLPARFFFSPDDQWLLQIQEFKDQNFHNLALLYRIEPNGRIWRMEDPLSAAAFKYLEQSQYLPTEHLFYTGAEFETWDFPAGLLRFSIHASCAQYCAGTEKIERSLIYNLRKHTFGVATKP
jgi:hypothetical protein